MERKIKAFLRRLPLQVLVFIVETVQGNAAQYDPDNGAVCLLCGQEKVRVVKTSKPIRSHKCQRCGLTFPSVEKKAA